MRTVAALLLSLIVLPCARSQDDVLAVERRSDLRAHAAAAQLLRATRMPLVVADLPVKELCKLLTAATGERVVFQCSTKVSDAAPKLTLDLRAASLWSILSIAQVETGLRFVYRFGAVFVVPADEVVPLVYLRLYDLRAQFMPLRSFPGPELGLRGPGDDRPLFPAEVETGETVSGFTAEAVEALVRAHVRPESWDTNGVSITANHGLLLIRQTPQAHREIDALLVELGLVAPPAALRAVPSHRVERAERPSRKHGSATGR